MRLPHSFNSCVHYIQACCSPAVRYYDVVVPNVPPGLKFEGKFHGGTLLHVEAGSFVVSSSYRTHARALHSRLTHSGPGLS